MGQTQVEAYRQAGFSGKGSGNQSNLAKKHFIRARVAELIEMRTGFQKSIALPIDESLVIDGEVSATRAWIEQQLIEVHRMALAAGRFTAATQSLKLLSEVIAKAAPAPQPQGREPAVDLEALNRMLTNIPVLEGPDDGKQ
jgi:hypothetical protein